MTRILKPLLCLLALLTPMSSVVLAGVAVFGYWRSRRERRRRAAALVNVREARVR